MKRAKRWFWALLLGAALVAAWRVYETGALWDQSKACGEFEFKISGVLARHGISNADVALVLHLEKKQMFPIPTSWVETEREIRLPRRANLKNLERDLKKATADSALQVLDAHPVQGGINLELGKDNKVFQRLLIHPK